jgi:pyruvate dehydrogenase E2 component (dihydrolipoamide acetyltransferase)
LFPKINNNEALTREFGTGSLPPHKELGMPALSPTMSQGNIAQWKKKEGDKIAAGDIIAEIETDKATIDFEAQDDGYLAKIIAPSGSKDILVNQTIAIIVDKQGDVGKFKSYAAGQGAQKPQQAGTTETPHTTSQEKKPSVAAEKVPTKKPTPSKDYPPHITIGMPALSPTMTEGTITKWKKQAGDNIKVGESIAEIETDKAVIDFESQEDGFMAKILVPDGTHNISINTPIAIMVDKQSDVAKFVDYEAMPPQSKKADSHTLNQQEEPAKQTATPPTTPSHQKTSTRAGDRVVASPLARSVAKEKALNIADISGTGPNNRVLKADVLEFAVSKPTSAEVPAVTPAQTTPPVRGEFTDMPVSNIRKVTAQRLLLSKQTIPHYYLSIEAKVDQLLKLRADLNAQANGKYKLSVNDFIIKASALAMHRVPAVNSSWNDQFIRRYHNVDINVAVNTEQGLFTPIVKDADKKGLAAIANSVKALAEKAKDNKLQPTEFQGGTFTISNLGMFGIKHFAAVINPPQAAILAVGGVEKRLVPSEDQFEVANILSVTLSCDHRVIDGAVGAEWLQAFKEYIEHPIKMLL